MSDQNSTRKCEETVMPAAEQIELFWQMLENCWEIEPRSCFEREAPRNGFGSPLAMAVHYMWKRETKAPSYVVNCQSCGAKVELFPEARKAQHERSNQ